MSPLLYVLIGITLLGVLAVLFVLLRERNKPQQPDQSALMLQEQFNALQQRLDAFGQTVATNLQSSTASMNKGRFAKSSLASGGRLKAL